MTDGHGPQGSSVRALVYGDVNLNVIDGSAIWATAAVEVLAEAGCAVTLVLKGRVTTERLLAPLAEVPNVRVVRPFEERLEHAAAGDLLSPESAVKVMRALDDEARFDVVVLRGIRVVRAVIDDGHFDRRIWTHLTDIPQSVVDLTQEAVEELGRIADASRLMLCQTEEIRAFLESAVPQVNGKAVLFPPVVPAHTSTVEREPLAGRPLRVAYSGKFAPLWNTEEMTRLPALLEARGVPMELHVVGDKIHYVADDPDYTTRMEEALRGSPGVVWHGGRSREEAIALVAGCDVGISWRHRALDASLELSTKVLEYGSVGLPVILNRTPMHEALLGEDYPLFANDEAEVVDQLQLAAQDAGIRAEAAGRCRAAADEYARSRAVSRVRGYIERYARPGRPSSTSRRLRVVVASHDFKFFSRLLERLEMMPELEVRVDRWPTVVQHDAEASQKLADWADTVICEWFGPNVLWYSEHMRPDQRLIARLHRFELYGQWPARADISKVDRVVCVSSHYAALTRERTGWPAASITVVPNYVDDAQLDRPKLPGANVHIGMIGVGESRKRVDLALDVLDEVRRHDQRFRLFAKTKMPWDYPWIWRRPDEPEVTDRYLRRIQTSERLRGSVVFDRFGPDVATWLRRVGFVLSTSDDESFHLAPAEGMASGAVPVVRRWPGADSIYDERWVHDTPHDMAAAILSTAPPDRWNAEREIARTRVRESFGLDTVTAAWKSLILDPP